MVGLTVRLKLLLSFGIILAFLLLGGLLEVRRDYQLAEQTLKMYEYPLTVTRAALKAESLINGMHRSMKDVALSWNQKQFDKAVTMVQKDEKEALANLELVEEQIVGVEGEQIARATKTTFLNWQPIRKEVIALVRAGKRDEAVDITRGKGATHVEKLIEETGKLIDYADQEAKTFTRIAKETVTIHSRDLLVLVVLSLGSGLALAWFVSAQIADRIKAIHKATGKIVDGALGHMVEVSGSDEIAELADSFNLMSHFLAETTVEIQKRMNESVTAREVLAKAQQIAHIGSWEWHIDTGELNWSDEVYRIFGLPPQSIFMTYPEYIDMVHEKDRPKVEAAIRMAIDNLEPYSIVHRIKRPSGKERIVRETGEVTFSDTGAPVLMVGVVHDITESKQVEADLERAKMKEISLQRERNELKNSLIQHQTLTGWQHGSVTASLAGIGPLEERSPTEYASIKQDYEHLLDEYLEALGFNRTPPRQNIADLVEKMGAMGAGPRDVIDLHIKSVASKSKDVNPRRARAYTVEGRLLALETMGNLVDYYRRRKVKA